MYRTIVVGHKRDERGEDALALARLLASGDGVERVIVVEAVHEHGRALDRLPDVTDGWPPFVDVSARTVAGSSAGGTLSAVAAEENADLLVLGSTHRGFAGRVVLGTTAGSIMPDVNCTIAIAPKGYAGAEPRLDRLGVAYDGTEESHAALVWAGEIARTYGTTVRLVSVVEPPPPPAETWGGSVPAEAWTDGALIEQNVQVTDMLRTRAQTEVEEASASLGRADTETVVVIGGVQHELREAAADLDLLVIGTHKRGALATALGGSVSRNLLHSCPAPLAVVPRAPRPARESP